MSILGCFLKLSVHIKGDIEKLNKMFADVLSNATNFLSLGTEVDVELKTESFIIAGLCALSFTVSDKGAGIPIKIFKLTVLNIDRRARYTMSKSIVRN